MSDQSTNEPITPALTPEQWAAPDVDLPPAVDAEEWTRLARSSDVQDGIYIEEFWENGCASVHAHPRARHALAALCLHGQPFGFTHDDVDAIRNEYDPYVRERLESIAARIAALLPPAPRPTE